MEQRQEISREKAVDAMLLDLYLRENLKSRPSFAPSQKPYEKMVWEYRREKKIPKTAHIEVFQNGDIVLFDYETRNPLTNNAETKTINEEVKEYGYV